MLKSTGILTAIVLSLSVSSAFAQDQEKPEKIVLEQKVGSIMASTGGDYETAGIGKLLIRDESLMVADGAKATVVYYYDNGKRKCTEVYEGPNTFVIDDSCKKAAYIEGTSGMTGAGAGIIAGTAVIGGIILNSMDNTPPQPISAGAR